MKALNLTLTAILIMLTIPSAVQGQSWYYLVGWEYPQEKGTKPVISNVVDTRGCNESFNLEGQFVDQYRKEHPKRYSSLHRIEIFGPYDVHGAEHSQTKKAIELYKENEQGLINVHFMRFICGYNSPGNLDVISNEGSGNSKPSQGYITVEKKDTKFQEAEAKRILEEKKAEVRRQVKLQAIKNQATPQQKERIKKVLVGSSRQ